MSEPVTDSRFYMWRTLFAIVHADQNVSKQEVRFMAEVLEDVPFSDAQRAILREDMLQLQDPVEMFRNVTSIKDQAQFFKIARDVVWADGAYSLEEQDILLTLKKMHVSAVSVDDLVDHVDLEFEEEKTFGEQPQRKAPAPKKKGLRGFLDSLAAQLRDERDIKH